MLFTHIMLVEIGFQFLLSIMSSNLAVKFAPIVSDKKKLEVSLISDQAVIKLSTWTENLGWTCQKTLALDAEMLDDLHRIIASARYKLKSENSTDGDTMKSANILEFPKFS